MPPKKNSSLLYFLASVGLVVVAIIFTAVVDRVRSPQSAADIRARAGQSRALKFTAVVSEVDEAEGTLTVDNLRFADQGRSATIKTLGTWKVTPPARFRLTSVAPGSRVTLSVNPTTFQATTHSFTATEITVNR